METKKLPVGIENFEEIRTKNFYYVDKTSFIIALLNNWGKVNLFTRPRRFGKTLTMKMLQAFFEIGRDHRKLFDGLAVSQEEELCAEHMNRYPVIFLSLKSVEGQTFESALRMLATQVARECMRLSFLAESPSADKDQCRLFKSLKAKTAPQEDLSSAVWLLSQMLEAHYNQKVVLLIDEYDVPLDKAFHNGYYDQMVSFMRLLLGEALKTNDALEFAVLTGCLRISKESIFTGLNNLKTHTILDSSYDEYFGFTDTDVKKMLQDYSIPSAYEDLRTWYNGYRFGQTDIYCPWDIINHIDRLRNDPQAQPEAYWNNTSSNNLVKRFIDKADSTTQEEIEQLIAGGSVEKNLKTDLTYAEIDDSIDNLWSILFMTGYLTQKPTIEKLPQHIYRLVIPNREIQEIFIEKIQRWFTQCLQAGDRSELDTLYKAFLTGDTPIIETLLNHQLFATISYHDYYENYYHGFLTGLLKGCGDWRILSNRESGYGRSDILIFANDRSQGIGIVIEVKQAESFKEISAKCQAALEQIETQRYYQEAFQTRRLSEIRMYGIAFWKKNCGVMGRRANLEEGTLNLFLKNKREP